MKTPTGPAGDSPSPAATHGELQQVLAQFGIRGEPLQAQGDPQQMTRVLIRTADGDHGQLRVYPASPESARRVTDSLRAHLHLRQTCPQSVLAPRRAAEGEIVTRGDALYAYLVIPPGFRPLPPQWDVVVMTQLGKCAGTLAIGARNHLTWPRVESGRQWVKRQQEAVARAQRLADPGSGLLAVLPAAIGDRVAAIADSYLQLAKADAELAPTLAGAYESAVWDAAGGRAFVIAPPSPQDLFLDPKQAVVLAWPERIATGVVWEGLLGEIARGRVTEDLDGALAALEAAHRTRPFSADELALLPLVASPVPVYLELIEGAIADAPVAREDLLLQLLDRWVAHPERAEGWRRALRDRVAAWNGS